VFFSRASQANCLPLIESKIIEKQDKLIKVKTKEKQIIKGVAIGTFVPMTLFWGTMAKLIIDGGTIATAVLVGTGYGVVIAGGAVAAVSVPMVTYNQILKARIRGLEKIKTLLADARESKLESHLLKKMLKKIKRQKPEMTMDDLIYSINEANEQEIFCQENEKIYGFNQVKKYLTNENLLSENELAFIVNDL